MFTEESAREAAGMAPANQQPAPVAEALYPSTLNVPKCSVAPTTRYVLEGSGKRVSVHVVSPIHNKRKGGGIRAPVTWFSSQSRKHMMLACAAISWTQVPKERCFFVKLTHRYVSSTTPSPKVCHHRLHERFISYLGSDGFAAVWKQEFTSAGEWHLHMFLTVWRLPRSLAKEWNIARDDDLPPEFLNRLQGWIARTWCSILGTEPGDESIDSLSYCKYVLTVEGAVNYVRKGPGSHNRKRHQAMLPDSLRACGRWWGLWGSKLFPRNPRFVELSTQEFHDVRRLVRKEMESHPEKGYVPHIYSPVSGMDIVAGGKEDGFWKALFEYVSQRRRAA